jgi:hypothetical protein
MVSETLGFYPQLTRLVALEDFIETSLISYKSILLLVETSVIPNKCDWMIMILCIQC